MSNITFSKNYLIFYDKLEKANWFLEHILQTRKMPLRSRTVQYLLNHVMTDRGQWSMAENLIQKYGLVPYEIMEDSVFSENTGELNASLGFLLRHEAMNLRAAAKEGMRDAELYEKKDRIMNNIRELLLRCYGEPPKKIICPGYIEPDAEKQAMSPVAFFQEYIKFPFDDYVSITPYGQKKSQDGVNRQIILDGNVIGGKVNQFLQVPDSTFQKTVHQQIEADIPCWCTCDAGKFFFCKDGVYDDSVFDFSKLPGNMCFEDLSREEIVSFHVGAMNHAMVLKAYRETDLGGWWMAKNSAEQLIPFGGYCFLADSWFGRYVFQAAVKREFLPEQYQNPTLQKQMAPWDFFGLS